MAENAINKEQNITMKTKLSLEKINKYNRLITYTYLQAKLTSRFISSQEGFETQNKFDFIGKLISLISLAFESFLINRFKDLSKPHPISQGRPSIKIDIFNNKKYFPLLSPSIIRVTALKFLLHGYIYMET